MFLPEYRGHVFFCWRLRGREAFPPIFERLSIATIVDGVYNRIDRAWPIAIDNYLGQSYPKMKHIGPINYLLPTVTVIICPTY